MRSVWATQRGSSLVELLTSTLFVSTLMLMAYGFARAALMNARLQEAKSEAQEVTVMAIDVLARELRMAGFSAAGTPLMAVRAAAPDRVEVACDLNGDGDSADSNELIAYTYNPDKRQLMRATGGGSPQPFVRNVAADGVRFAFIDAGGAPVSLSSGGGTTAERSRICRIDVELRVALPNPDPTIATPLTSRVSSSVYLRNQ